MIVPAGFHLYEIDHFLTLLPPAFGAARSPDLDGQVVITNPLGRTRIRIACGLSPTARQYVVVWQPTEWLAESGFATLPGPLLAAAWASNIKRDVLANPPEVQAIVRHYGLSMHEWTAPTAAA